MAKAKVKTEAPAKASLSVETITAVVAETIKNGFTFMPENELAVYEEAGYIEANREAERDGNGSVMVRATEVALTEFGPDDAGAETEVEAFAIETGTLPGLKRGGGSGRPSLFPFEQLAAPVTDDKGNIVYSNFHVAKTPTRKDPANSLGSIVTAANRKYATATGETKEVKRHNRTTKATETVRVPVYSYSRKFTLRAVGKDDPKGEGARVYRIA
jgi:hypothetical protein